MTEKTRRKNQLLEQLSETHVHFARLMEERLAHADVEDVERYFGLLSAFVAKLEESDKTLRDAVREMAAEYAALILNELAGG